MTGLSLNKNITCMTYMCLHQNNFNDLDEISRKAMGNSWWMELRSRSTNKMHGEEHSEERNYITQWSTDWPDRNPKIKIEPQESSRGPGGQGPSANLSSPIPVPHGGSDHGRLPQEGWGGPGGRWEPPLHHGWHADCFILRTIPHHPGFGKCSWSLLVGCKGKKNAS